MKSFGTTQKGLRRKNNEDAFDFLPGRFFILADGMGGHNAGEIAAGEAVRVMKQAVSLIPVDADLDKMIHFLRGALMEANAQVWKLSQRYRDYHGMGTTLSCCLLHEQHLVYAHVGDSRLYRYRQQLELLTQDHSQQVRMSDALSSSRAVHRHVITRALGTGPFVIPDMGILSVTSSDRYLLCSDGLSNQVLFPEIAEILKESTCVESSVGRLMGKALERGAPDDTTILVLELS